MTDLPEPNFRFPAKYRLKRRSDFAKVYAQGAVAADPTLVIHAIRNDLAITRIGLSIAKPVGSAPVRNRWKRWLREAHRLHRRQLPIGLDLVIRPRRGAQGSYRKVLQSMRALLAELDRKLP